VTCQIDSKIKQVTVEELENETKQIYLTDRGAFWETCFSMAGMFVTLNVTNVITQQLDDVELESCCNDDRQT